MVAKAKKGGHAATIVDAASATGSLDLGQGVAGVFSDEHGFAVDRSRDYLADVSPSPTELPLSLQYSPGAKQLGDLLTTEQILTLYTDPSNGFGSSAILAEVRELANAYGRLNMAEGGFVQRYANGAMHGLRRDTHDLLVQRGAGIIEERLNHYADTNADRLAPALLRMGVSQQDIDQLPTHGGYIDDTSFAMEGRQEKSGTAILAQYFKAELEKQFPAPGLAENPTLSARRPVPQRFVR